MDIVMYNPLIVVICCCIPDINILKKSLLLLDGDSGPKEVHCPGLVTIADVVDILVTAPSAGIIGGMPTTSLAPVQYVKTALPISSIKL
jgi:hypothetical protein